MKYAQGIRLDELQTGESPFDKHADKIVRVISIISSILFVIGCVTL